MGDESIGQRFPVLGFFSLSVGQLYQILSLLCVHVQRAGRMLSCIKAQALPSLGFVNTCFCPTRLGARSRLLLPSSAEAGVSVTNCVIKAERRATGSGHPVPCSARLIQLYASRAKNGVGLFVLDKPWYHYHHANIWGHCS